MDTAILLISSCLVPITVTSAYFSWKVHNVLVLKKTAQSRILSRLAKGK